MFPTWRLGRVLQGLHLCACLFAGPRLLPPASNESCSDLQLMDWLSWALTWPIQLFTRKHPTLHLVSLDFSCAKALKSKVVQKTWRSGQFLKASCATVQTHEEWSNSKFTAYNFATQPSNSLRYISHIAHSRSVHSINYSKSNAICVSRLISASAPSALTYSMEGQTSDYQTVT